MRINYQVSQVVDVIDQRSQYRIFVLSILVVLNSRLFASL